MRRSSSLASVRRQKSECDDGSNDDTSQKGNNSVNEGDAW